MVDDLNPADRLRAHGADALAGVFAELRPRLERMIEFRLDRRIQARIDPADVLQESFLRLSRRLEEHLAGPPVSAFVWMREITMQTLIDLQRHHFGQMRHPDRELVRPATDGNSTSLSIAQVLLAPDTSPSLRASREEELERLRAALETLNETDREVLALRHFEQLSNVETAEILNLTSTAASNRYVRAMSRLAEILGG